MLSSAIHRTIGIFALVAASLQQPAYGQSNGNGGGGGSDGRVRITGLQDVQFGTFGLGGDSVQSQSLCVFSSTRIAAYSVIALGTGPSSAFTLESDAGDIAFDVLWSEATGQTFGSELTAGQPSQAFTSAATHHACNNGPLTSASLIIRVREAEIASARAGNYSGSLTLIVSPN